MLKRFWLLTSQVHFKLIDGDGVFREVPVFAWVSNKSQTDALQCNAMVEFK